MKILTTILFLFFFANSFSQSGDTLVVDANKYHYIKIGNTVFNLGFTVTKTEETISPGISKLGLNYQSAFLNGAGSCGVITIPNSKFTLAPVKESDFNELKIIYNKDSSKL